MIKKIIQRKLTFTQTKIKVTYDIRGQNYFKTSPLDGSARPAWSSAFSIENSYSLRSLGIHNGIIFLPSCCTHRCIVHYFQCWCLQTQCKELVFWQMVFICLSCFLCLTCKLVLLVYYAQWSTAIIYRSFHAFFVHGFIPSRRNSCKHHGQVGGN